MWEVKTGRLVRTFKPTRSLMPGGPGRGRGRADALASLPGGLLASAGSGNRGGEGMLAVWEVATGQLVRDWSDETNAAGPWLRGMALASLPGGLLASVSRSVLEPGGCAESAVIPIATC